MNTRLTSAAQGTSPKRSAGIADIGPVSIAVSSRRSMPQLLPSDAIRRSAPSSKVRSRYLLSGFPYAVFYLVREPELVVVGCMHGARDPENWPGGAA